jgi:hypothetical protein
MKEHDWWLRQLILLIVHDLLRRRRVNLNKLMKMTPHGFSPSRIQTSNRRSCLEESMGIPRDWWKKRPKVEKHHQKFRKIEEVEAQKQKGRRRHRRRENKGGLTHRAKRKKK